jgi:excisionase family DNA binding protein
MASAPPDLAHWPRPGQAAARLDVSEQTILRMIARQRLRAVNVSAGALRPRWRIDPASLAALLPAHPAN